MSRSIVAHSPDLHRLWSEGYDITLTRGNHLVVGRVPYVTADRSIMLGRLVSPVLLTVDGVATITGTDHTVYFIGEAPCDERGERLNLINSEGTFVLEHGLTAQFRFSIKPTDTGQYADYYAKMTAYVGHLMTRALALDPNLTAKPGEVLLEQEGSDSSFVYRDTASTRAGIVAINDRLRGQKVAIVGVGGTGSYILDQVAKTPVAEIHLFDGDDFRPHNAFRAPGAASYEELLRRPTKVEYFADRYKRMKRNIIAHSYEVDETTVEELRVMNFVFISAEGGGIKRLLVSKLEEFGIPFIDVGLGLDRNQDQIGGLITVATSTPQQRQHVHENARIDFSEAAVDDDYDDNIQIADLNALNAVLAVIRWKKVYGVHRDQKHEHFAAYNLETNHIINEVFSDGQG